VRAKNAALLLASLVFYAWGEPAYIRGVRLRPNQVRAAVYVPEERRNLPDKPN
jgi:hypothetical protein